MNLIEKIQKKIKSYFFFISLNKVLQINKNYPLNYYGSSYGGWLVYDNYLNSSSIIISCGVGEDVSFDIELMKKFDCKIHLFDPTPRSIEHINSIFKNPNLPCSLKYSNSGKQDIESYDLNKISLNNLNFHDKAVWNEDTQIKFYLPPNKEHVSHSINNYQNNYDQNSEYILVNAINFVKYLKVLNIYSIDLLKLDIEGAEIEVIESILKSDLIIKQICVEFDELHLNNKISKTRMLKTYNLLISNGFKCINSDKNVNYTFFLDN